MMSAVQFEDVVELALQLSPAEQPVTDAEIAEMFNIQPMTGAEIVAAGLLGGWKHLDIQDGAEWVNEQKRRRKEKRRW